MGERPDPDGWGGAGLRAGFRLCVRRGLAGVWVRGSLPAGPVVWAGNHHSWWDGFVAAEVLGHWSRPAGLVMDRANLVRYPLMARAGAIGTHQVRTGLALLRSGRVLVVYPEGALGPNGPPRPLAPGAAWLAARSPALLCSAAGRIRLRGRPHPEAYLILRSVAGGGPIDEVTERLWGQLAADLAIIDDLDASADPAGPLPGFEQVAAGRRSWNERIDQLHRWTAWTGR